MTATRKSMRFLTVLALICAMVLSIASTPVSAAGVETWYKGSLDEPSFLMNGYNLTPVKTMGVSGKLTITEHFETADGNNPDHYYPVYVLEIRSLNGTVLARESKGWGFLYSGTLSVSIDVTKGQQIQIYTSVYEKGNTNFARKANIWYNHTLV